MKTSTGFFSLTIAVVFFALLFALFFRTPSQTSTKLRSRLTMAMPEEINRDPAALEVPEPASPTDLIELNNRQTQNSPVPVAQTLTPLTADQVSSRRSSVNATLIALYTTEIAYQAEFGRFTTDFHQLGYRPEDEVLLFKSGFLKPFVPNTPQSGEESSRLNSDAFNLEITSDGTQPYSYDAYSKNVNLASIAHYCRQQCTATEDTFEIIAAFNIDDDAGLDVWSINQNKTITHLVDDTVSF